MTIELTREQEKLVRGFVESGRYESVEAFIDSSIAQAFIETEAFVNWARERDQQAREDIKAGRVVTVASGKMADVLEQHRNGTLTFKK
jgi:Arc/MetJ-type ribon-helix-helix transcriptional regulator